MTPPLSTLAAACVACVLPFIAQAQAQAQVHAQVPDVAALVKTADQYRVSISGPTPGTKAAPAVVADNLQVDTQVQLFNADGTLNKERRYTVFAQGPRQSLVLMQSPAEKGQKVLMLGDDFWLLLPNSQRPVRITPMQKLLGDASTGDIATLSWSGDYAATLVGEEACQADKDFKEKLADVALSANKHCYHISMQANRKGVTYQRVELWVGTQRHEPVRADLYVQSDKLAKQAHFIVDKPGAGALVSDMLLVDQLGNQKVTRVSYLSRKARTVPTEWLNPMFLARNPALE